MRKISKRAAVIATTATLAISGGAAWAIWSVSGSGDVSAASSTVAPLTADTVALAGSLYPGAQRPVTVTVKNSNDFPVIVTALNRQGVNVSNPEACSPGYINFVPDALPTDRTVAAKATLDGLLNVTGKVSMANDAPMGCAGQTFTVRVGVVGQVGS